MVNNFSNHELNSVSDLLRIMDQSLYSNRARWIYRGQANKNWKLIPSIGRLYKKKNFKNVTKLYQFEKNAFAEFLIRNYALFRESNKISNLAIAQHHGLKTRLMDWTFSPLFALFFAVENESHYNKDGILYAYENTQGYNIYNQQDFDPLDETTFTSEYYFIWAPSLTPRIKAQLGVFQLFRKPHMEFTRPFNFHKIIIPSKSKAKIKTELFNLGISYDSVYPEIDGIAKSINFYKLRGN